MPKKTKSIKVQPKTVHPKRQHSLEAALSAEAAWDAGYKEGYEAAVADIRKRFNV